MLRITRVNHDRNGGVHRKGAITLRLEGKLLGPWAGEIVNEFERARSDSSGGPVVLDLANLAYADAEGVRTLRELFGRGAQQTGCSAFVAELLFPVDSTDTSKT